MLSAPSRSRWKSALQWGLTVTAIVAIGIVLARHSSDLSRLLSLDARVLALMTLGAIGTYATSGMILQALVGHFRMRMPFSETFLLGLMDGTLNYLPMKAGTVATGAYLFSRLGLSPAEYAAIVVGNGVVNLWTTTTLSGLVLLVAGFATLPGVALCVVPTIAVAGLMAWSARRSFAPARGRRRVVRIALRLAEGLGSISGDRRLIGELVLVNTARVAAASFQLYWAFRAVSASVSVGEVVLLSALSVLAQRATVIPGGLGLKEGGIAGAAALVGIPVPVALAAAVIDRAIQIATVLVLGVPATAFLSRSLRNHAETGLDHPNAEGDPEALGSVDTQTEPVR